MADYIKEHYDFPLTAKSENKPLKGVRVIDAGNMVAAPSQLCCSPTSAPR
jgi:hypothetical protein